MAALEGAPAVDASARTTKIVADAAGADFSNPLAIARTQVSAAAFAAA